MRITPFGLNEEIKETEAIPFNESNQISETDETNEAINEILLENNLVNKDAKGTSPNSKLSSYLTQAGGSLEKVAENIVGIMNRGDTDSGRLKAAEFISKMHGVQIQLEETSKNNNEKPPIVINVAGVDSKTMINFFMPKS